MPFSAETFFEASVNLEAISPPAKDAHSITPQAQGFADPLPLASVLPPDLATCVTVFFPSRSATPGWILARLVDDDRSLELRWLSLVQEEPGELDVTFDTLPGLYNELDKRTATAPVLFTFADPLLPDVHLIEADGNIIVHVLSRMGVLTRLTFAGPQFFLSRDLDAGCSGDYAVTSVSGKTPTLFHGVSDDAVLIACSDGSLISMRRTASAKEHWTEAELSISSGLWPVRALLPTRFSTRNLTALSTAESESPARTVAITSLVGGADVVYDVSYTLSRDYKLRVWQNHTVCARTLDLAPSSNALLGTEPRNLLRAVFVDDDRDYSAYLVAAIEDRFLIYGVPRGKKRDTELRQIGVQACPSGYGMSELRDFRLATLDPASQTPEQDWVLWTLWERADGGPEIAFSELVKAGPDAHEVWTHVQSPGDATFNADYFDDLLTSDTTKNTNDIFMEHIFAPGRYSTGTIGAALEAYTDTVLNSSAPGEGHPPALMRGDEYDSLAEQIADVVGCTLSLDISAETGQPLHAQYEARLRTEWLRFVSLCNEGRALTRFPLLLAIDSKRQLALAIARGAVIAPFASEVTVGLDAVADHVPRHEREQVNGAAQGYEVAYEVLRAARILQDHLKVDAFKAFEDEAISINASARRHPFEELAASLFADVIENHVPEEIFDDLKDVVIPLLPHLEAAIGAILPLDEVQLAGDVSASDFALALTTAAVGVTIELRYEQGLRILLFLIYLASDSDVASPGARALLPKAFNAVHGLHVIRWLTRQPAPPLKLQDSPHSDDSGSLASRLGGLNVGGSADSSEDPTPVISLFGMLARYRLPGTISTAISTTAIASAGASLIDGLGLLSQYAETGDPSLVKFMADSGLPAQSVALSHLYRREEAGLLFARACALLGLERLDEAQQAFSRCAASLVGSTLSPLFASVLPSDLTESPARLFLYYRWCAQQFETASCAAGVAHFAHLALDAASATTAPDVDLDDTVRALWQQLFEANVALNRFEEAYTTLMAIPDLKIQETCLRILVVQMCENGQVESLLRLSFAGLQQQFGAHLDYRARHAKFGSTPDYHHVAYSYHLSRGNYKDAAAVMLLRVRQLEDLGPMERISFHDVARERCRSYLVAINALYLVDEKDAWLAVPVDRRGAVDVTESASVGKRRQTIDGTAPPGPKRRRIASGKHLVVDHIPDQEHGEAAARCDIVTLEMLREEYAMALAKLTLATSFPELAHTELDIDPEGVVALYAEKGEISSAFAVAQILDADLTILFERLTARCVQAARGETYVLESDADWLNSLDEAASLEGNFAARVWHVLRIYLDRYDRPDGRYRIAVLRKALSSDRSTRLPVWLTSRFADKDPDSLLRILISYDRIDEALGVALAIVHKAAATLGRGQGIKPTFLRLPYPILDRLLRVSLSASDASEDNARDMQSRLGAALQDFLPKLGRAYTKLQTQHRKTAAAQAIEIDA